MEIESEEMEAVLPIGKRITLHRTPVVGKNEQKIKENLQTLKMNMHKKQLAQRFYYDQPGQSPLHRVENKQSVHDRLGNPKIKLFRTMAYDFSTTDGIIRNKRIQKQTNEDGSFKLTRLSTNFKRNSAQARLQKIRQQRAAENFLANSPLFSKIRLKRNRQQPAPVNYTVQVTNESALQSNIPSNLHSVKGSLNISLQQDIKILQIQNRVEPTIVPNSPIYTNGFGVTGMSMHNRFSSLP